MQTKIFLLVLAVVVVISGFFTFYSYSWLQSIGSPENVAINYQYFSGIATIFLWISAAALLIIANVIGLKTRKTWALWATFAYFAIFIVLQTYWLNQIFFDYKKQYLADTATFSFGLILAFAFIVLAAIVVSFNQHFLKKIYDRRHPAQIAEYVENELVIEN